MVAAMPSRRPASVPLRKRQMSQRRGRRRPPASVARCLPPASGPSSGGGPDGWRDFAASFVAAGLVEAPEVEQPAEEEPLTAVEAKGGSAVLLLPQGRALTFNGKCCLTCLYGSVRVFGFNIVPDQPPYNLFSPHTHCALSIEAVAYKESEKSKKELKGEARSILRAHLVPRAARIKLMKSFVPQCSMVLLEHLETPATRLILSHIEFSRVFTAKKKKVPCSTPEDAALASTSIMRQDPGNGLLLSESSLSAIGELVQACQEEDEGCPVILVCGPKSVGKSTFNRYLINLCLPCIEFLEGDLGQTEFTPPGCISLINVTEPFLGPPFTHLRTPHKMVYFGETSCEQDTERYLDTLKYVFSAYERDVPLVINTMGWVKGAGLLLLIDIIRLLSPSHIVQISADNFNDMPQLTPEYTCSSTGLHTKGKGPLKCKSLENGTEDLELCRVQGDFRPPHSGHRLLCVQPEFPGAGIAGHGQTHRSVLRDMAVLAYLGQLQPSDMDLVLPLHSLVPYQVPFSAVSIKVIHTDVAPAHILYSVNASWVGLCRLPEEVHCKADRPVFLTQTPICDCLGFGIVRGVDMDKKLYHILTPVAPENLRLVNCLLIGNIPVPNCVFLNQPGIEGEIPYVTAEYNYGISGAGKLKIKKHLKRREHM
ncbi:PREDICTED: polynucleotide 5'-hydroxyl-kinase NOL9 [Gekko japonicus]|uniref:Polynucleotide 5'-hydroxyl-kinase NOL9 n=1 Tax=Gekko japonicus TaxID=146911 RepID=A0ABM1JJV6_GEKJA|nr:PREDICTED: polynucleotide 5'-hydroxyl-kinase NOL9 [Gekko japonicus]